MNFGSDVRWLGQSIQEDTRVVEKGVGRIGDEKGGFKVVLFYYDHFA